MQEQPEHTLWVRNDKATVEWLNANVSEWSSLWSHSKATKVVFKNEHDWAKAKESLPPPKHHPEQNRVV